MNLDDILDTMADGLVSLDKNCKIHLWNRAMERITGYSDEEAIGQPASFLVCARKSSSDVDPVSFRKECTLMEANEDFVEEVECYIRRKDGQPVPVLKNARPLKDKAGNIAGVVETLTDLSYRKRLESELADWRRSLHNREGIGRLAGNSNAMHEIYERIRMASQSDATVLIHGDTGTGKELAAEAIHNESNRSDGPFVRVNCSALSENLLESELFGHVKGAFTGAVSNKEGRFETANGGTIFLDEIGDISPLIQLKLLRVIQEREFERVGESKTHRTDVRVIAATHRNLRNLVSSGRFREDFYYRIKVFDIEMPPLVDRKKDIPLLANLFIKRFNQLTGKRIRSFSEEVNHAFRDYCWPGNVRELENAIEHAFVTCKKSLIEIEDIPLEIRSYEGRRKECEHSSNSHGTPKQQMNGENLMGALQRCKWNKAAVAREMGVNRSTIWRRMKRWGISLDPKKKNKD